MITVYMNGEAFLVPEGSTVLQAARAAGVEVPTLCYLEGLTPGGGCRMCQVTVEVKGRQELRTACDTPVSEGMAVFTHSPEALEARKLILELLLSRHLHSCFNCDRHPACYNTLFPYCNYDKNCFTCGARDDCKLRKYALEAGIVVPGMPNLAEERPVVTDNRTVTLDANRCILCRRCVAVCKKAKAPGYINIDGRGAEGKISIPAGENAGVCLDCGRCAESCPTGALQKS